MVTKQEKMQKMAARINTLFLFLLFISTTALQAQNSQAMPEFQLEKQELEAHLRFLAADELQGRRTGEMGNNIAARYIAVQLEAMGLTPPPGQEGFYQKADFEATTPPTEAAFILSNTEYKQGEGLFMMTGNVDGLKTEAVFANYGWADPESGYDDYKGLDVKGKAVIVLPGTPEGDDPMAVFTAMRKKREIAQEKGAAALIELYRLQFPWAFFRSYFNKENLSLAENQGIAAENTLAYGWLKEQNDGSIQKLQEGKKLKVELSSSGYKHRLAPSQNVAGIITGSDPELRDEYVVLTAHYDHVGTGKNGGGAYSAKDSIFNGSRDNAMGVAALLAAAKSLAEHPPRRSVLILAFTGEELGLLGSQFYASHPLIPLKQTVFNLNTDGAGYNDVSYVSAIGFGRTGTDQLIEAGAHVFGLDVFPNPAPEQGLFDRSDNVSFAAKGVPAMTISPGMTSFDEQIGKYYHQVADNPDTIDFDYLLKYSQAFARMARLIADEQERPQWAEGDKYEAAGKALYGK